MTDKLGVVAFFRESGRLRTGLVCRWDKRPAPAAEEKPKGVSEKALAAADAKSETAAMQASERVRDLRVPAPGTVLQKKDRLGAVRCGATGEETGIRYDGVTCRSLSAAAMAVAKDLGLGQSQNGFLVWGVDKQARRAGDPVAALARAWTRRRAWATSLVGSVQGESLQQVRGAIGQHIGVRGGLAHGSSRGSVQRHRSTFGSRGDQDGWPGP